MGLISNSCLSFVIFAAVFALLFAESSAFGVDLFEHKHFKGRSTNVDVRQGCVDVPFEWDDLTSSIMPKECIIIYKHPRCQGPRVRLEPWTFGTAYLREINFEDKLSSMSPCNFAGASSRDRDEY